MKFSKLKHAKFTAEHTHILEEKEYKYNAPHTFVVRGEFTEKPVALVHFQEGPIRECGVNGVM